MQLLATVCVRVCTARTACCRGRTRRTGLVRDAPAAPINRVSRSITVCGVARARTFGFGEFGASHVLLCVCACCLHQLPCHCAEKMAPARHSQPVRRLKVRCTHRDWAMARGVLDAAAQSAAHGGSWHAARSHQCIREGARTEGAWMGRETVRSVADRSLPCGVPRAA